MEKVMVLSKNLDEGKKLYAGKDLDRAETRFEYVYTNSDDTPAFAQLKKNAAAGIVAVNGTKAQQAEARKDYAGALPYWEKALAVDPSNRELRTAYNNAKRLSDPVKVEFPGNKAATPELQRTVDRIQKLLHEGDLFTETGQYDRARSRYDAVLVIDPYNSVAQKKIDKILDLQAKAADAQWKARREKALMEVEDSFGQKVIVPPAKGTGIVVTDSSISRIDNMMAKLENIRIPSLNFNDVEISDAVAFLVSESQKLDPDKEGVNIVLKTEATAAPVTPGAPGAAPAPVSTAPKTITLNLKDVPLLDVLRVLTNLAALQFKVEEYAVFILPQNESADIIQSKSFQNIPAGFFTAPSLGTAGTPSPVTGPGAASAASANGLVATVAAVDVRKQLEDKGVKFPAGTSAAWLPRTNRLVIRNTLNQIDFVDRLISQVIGKSTPQIEIETNFVEFSEDKLKDASFQGRINIDASLPPSPPADFTLDNNPPTAANAGTNPPTSNDPTGMEANTNGLRGINGITPNSLDSALGVGANRVPNTISFSGVINGSGFRYVASLLESTLGANLMTAPSVVVSQNGSAKIEVVRDFRYPDPNGYEPPELPEGSGGGGEDGGGSVSSGVIIPSTPTEFVNRGVGVILNIKKARIENGLIDLQLEPEVTDFDGFINYGEAVTTLGGDDGVTQVVVSEGNLLTPVFSNRKISTVVRVLDGQTVMMGGLISSQVQEVKDRVPILGDFPLIGRLFQSKSSQNVKRNLVIFVTARSIKPDGRPENLSLSETEKLEISSIVNQDQ